MGSKIPLDNQYTLIQKHFLCSYYIYQQYTEYMMLMKYYPYLYCRFLGHKVYMPLDCLLNRYQMNKQ